MTSLSAWDVIRVGVAGLRTRPLRASLSALGIAIGIAAMVSVVGISASSRAELDRAVTGGSAAIQALPLVIPAWALLGGLVSTLLIGALAGVYPAIRASHLSPAEALSSP